VTSAAISVSDHDVASPANTTHNSASTKAGNAYLRSLLIECSNHILRPHGRDSALRQWGLHLAARGGKQAKSKAVVADGP